MGGPTDWIADAERAGAELRELIRRAHEAIGDMRRLMREFDDKRIEASALLSHEARKQIEPIVAGLVEDMGNQISKARDDSVRSVMDSFDNLGKILRGEHEEGPTVQEMAVAYRLAQLLQHDPGVEVKPDGSLVVNLDDAADRHRVVGRPKGKRGRV